MGFFACTACQLYVEAGLCGGLLERRGLVRPRGVLDMASILADTEYALLKASVAKVPNFQTVFEFIETHRGHRVEYLARELPEDVHLNYLQVGGSADSSPRFYVEVLRMTSWDHVLRWREALGRKWESDEYRERFRRAFEEHLGRFRGQL